MDIFSQFSDPLPLVSNSTSINKLDPSLLSDASTSTSTSTASRNTHSDEEVLLASSHPKKRAGRRIFKETRHPIFRGVRRRNNNKWVCELREPNKKSRIWLGTYPTPEMAARAHDVAALAFRGKNACLNFADSAWRLPVPASKDAKDIRRAAAEAAEAVRPREVEEVSSGDLRQERNTKLLELQENVYVPEKEFFMDEEAFFDMPRLIDDMAEGLLLSPPPLVGDGMNWDADVDSYSDVSLWSYSV